MIMWLKCIHFNEKKRDFSEKAEKDTTEIYYTSGLPWPDICLQQDRQLARPTYSFLIKKNQNKKKY